MAQVQTARMLEKKRGSELQSQEHARALEEPAEVIGRHSPNLSAPTSHRIGLLALRQRWHCGPGCHVAW
ncbi:hypothetical protein PI124_g22365 [Phytophthora idaei]|nr:hypothetical protein PI124_g22365 [Phytophthora idaei]